MAQLTCKDLRLGYDSTVIVDKLNFTVERGDYLCILGENGSGKTTLIKTILGLQPQLGGTISFNDGLKKQKIGYLPQQLSVQKDFPASVYEIVLSGCINKGKFNFIYTKKDKQNALDALNKLNILDIKKKSYRELSGGQQQRVLLARAKASADEMLILDEPTASLDPKATTELYELLYKLNKNEKMTVIMISHNIETAIKYASHILHVGSGQLFFGTVGDYIKSEIRESFCPNCKGVI